MNREEILTLLKNDKPFLFEKFGVEEIALFGSYARNEQTEASDIDMLVKFNHAKWGRIVSLWDYLEDRFKKKVDITTDGQHVSERFRRVVKNDIVYA